VVALLPGATGSASVPLIRHWQSQWHPDPDYLRSGCLCGEVVATVPTGIRVLGQMTGHRSIKNWVKRLLPDWALSRYRGLMEHRRLGRFRRDLAGYGARTVSHRYGGLALDVWLTDPVAEEWYDRDHPEANEIDFLRRSKLRPGATVFDIGAHQCVIALLLAHVVGPEGKVIAVEAHPHNAAVGVRNRDLNRAPQLEVINAAVGERPGRALLQESGLNSKVGKVERVGRIEVEAVTVDDLSVAHGAPAVIFIDVEGFECQVVRGARATLAARPDLMIEVHVGCGLEDFGESVESLLALIPIDAYDLFVAPGVRDGIAIDAGEFHPYQAGDPAMTARFFLAALARGL
jgi:FkbM family methyltransferase